MIPLCDLHTHTQFCDGKNTPAEMVEAAIRKGCFTLGFSGHAPADVKGGDTDWWIVTERLDVYRDEILKLKNQYQKQIEIALGLELDYFSPKVQIACDYTIGSVHYVKKSGEYIPVDATPDILKSAVERLYGGDFMAYAKDYFCLVSQVVEKTDCDIVGHFDLLIKFNEKHPYFDESNASYQKMALEALDSVMEKDVFIEINTGAISRGWRTMPYPAPFILKRIVEKKGKLVLNSDSHSAEHLLFSFEDAVALARSCGARELWVYRDQMFQPISI